MNAINTNSPASTVYFVATPVSGLEFSRTPVTHQWEEDGESFCSEDLGVVEYDVLCSILEGEDPVHGSMTLEDARRVADVYQCSGQDILG